MEIPLHSRPTATNHTNPQPDSALSLGTLQRHLTDLVEMPSRKSLAMKWSERIQRLRALLGSFYEKWDNFTETGSCAAWIAQLLMFCFFIIILFPLALAISIIATVFYGVIMTIWSFFRRPFWFLAVYLGLCLEQVITIVTGWAIAHADGAARHWNDQAYLPWQDTFLLKWYAATGALSGALLIPLLGTWIVDAPPLISSLEERLVEIMNFGTMLICVLWAFGLGPYIASFLMQVIIAEPSLSPHVAAVSTVYGALISLVAILVLGFIVSSCAT
ncbi:hypothetical protein DL96DRAFT_1821782 [Flagelloscypha sp. PMI_526]|nr:hypothetical protein DL96DRAFT_1821782 [Flagelloscypha sp. PMI_526]